jgi:hypothetical protein
MARGICRYIAGWGNGDDSVLVQYPDGRETEMAAENYFFLAIEPAVEELPFAPCDFDLDQFDGWFKKNAQ